MVHVGLSSVEQLLQWKKSWKKFKYTDWISHIIDVLWRYLTQTDDLFGDEMLPLDVFIVFKSNTILALLVFFQIFVVKWCHKNDKVFGAIWCRMSFFWSSVIQRGHLKVKKSKNSLMHSNLLSDLLQTWLLFSLKLENARNIKSIIGLFFSST